MTCTSLRFLSGAYEMPLSIRFYCKLRLIYSNDDGIDLISGDLEEFGRNLYSLWMNMMAETIGLCVYCIQDGQTGFSNMVQRYMVNKTLMLVIKLCTVVWLL